MFDNEYEKELRDKIKLLDKMLDDREILRTEYEIQRLETAKYKAYFFGYKEIREKIDKQCNENDKKFDIFYCGNKTTFRTLEDMKNEGILTEEEYKKII